MTDREPTSPETPEITPATIGSSREIVIAGGDERYRIRDGHLEIWFASDEKWIRQVPSPRHTLEAYRQEAGRHRVALAHARAMIDLFENPNEPAAPSPETTAPALCATCHTPMISERVTVERIQCGNLACMDCGRTQREYTVAPAPRSPAETPLEVHNRAAQAYHQRFTPADDSDPTLSAPSAPEEPATTLSASERFEQLADRFYRDTGMMAPGKDQPAAMYGQSFEDRSAAWDEWIKTSTTTLSDAQLLIELFAVVNLPMDAPEAVECRALIREWSESQLAALREENERLKAEVWAHQLGWHYDDDNGAWYESGEHGAALMCVDQHLVAALRSSSSSKVTETANG